MMEILCNEQQKQPQETEAAILKLTWLRCTASDFDVLGQSRPLTKDFCLRMFVPFFCLNSECLGSWVFGCYSFFLSFLFSVASAGDSCSALLSIQFAFHLLLDHLQERLVIGRHLLLVPFAVGLPFLQDRRKEKDQTHPETMWWIGGWVGTQ